MKVEFEHTVEDFINIQSYHLDRSPTLKKSRLFIRIVFPLLFIIFLFGIFYAIQGRIDIIVVLLPVIGAIALYFLLPGAFKKASIKGILNMLKEGDNKSELGRVSIELSDRGINSITEAEESIVKWDSIIKVEENNQYIFLYLSSTRLIPIPIKSFPSLEEKQRFVAFINDHMKK
jgi:hypothetical protein